ncbi:hypothetical protein BX616_000614 [Lobosporangium transversale]|nr:hypothetical protein BX616_000614 [Lobosporangium transversale]
MNPTSSNSSTIFENESTSNRVKANINDAWKNESAETRQKYELQAGIASQSLPQYSFKQPQKDGESK